MVRIYLEVARFNYKNPKPTSLLSGTYSLRMRPGPKITRNILFLVANAKVCRLFLRRPMSALLSFLNASHNAGYKTDPGRSINICGVNIETEGTESVMSLSNGPEKYLLDFTDHLESRVARRRFSRRW